MKRFSDIEQLRHVIKNVKNSIVWAAKEKYGDDFDGYKLEYPVMDFVGTVKLHGCNSGLVRDKDGIKFQSRNNMINIENDNYGFARYMTDVGEDELNKLFDLISSDPNDKITIFGEWIGTGIQKKVGIAQLARQFVIFNIHINDNYAPNSVLYEINKFNIHNILRSKLYMISIDMNDPTKAKEQLEEMVNEVDAVCPWAKMWGVNRGCLHGEGIVWCSVDNPENSDLWFKTKGKSHKASNQKEVVQIDPEVLATMNQFVNYALSDERLEQGYRFVIELVGREELDMNDMGKFISWVHKDIKKEEYDVLEVNVFEWKPVTKILNPRIREWYTDKIFQD